MKINISDNQGNLLAGVKYWAAIAALIGGISSTGSAFPEYTPLGLYNTYQAGCEAG